MSRPLLLDASIWLAGADPDDRYQDAALRLTDAAAEGVVQLAALDLTLYEVANVAVVRWRWPAIAEELVTIVQDACPRTLEQVDAELLRAAVSIASEHGITLYDAAYVAAARRRGWTLVSGDVHDLVDRGLAVAPDAALD